MSYDANVVTELRRIADALEKIAGTSKPPPKIPRPSRADDVADVELERRLREEES